MQNRSSFIKELSVIMQEKNYTVPHHCGLITTELKKKKTERKE